MVRFNLRFGLVHRLVADIRRRRHAIVERLSQVFIIVLVVRTIQEMSDDDASHMAAGVAYYAVFSIFPLALGTISIAAIVFTVSDMEDRVLGFLERNVGVGSEELVTSNIEAVLDARGAVGLIALVGLFWASRAVFGAVHRVMNRAWLV